MNEDAENHLPKEAAGGPGPTSRLAASDTWRPAQRGRTVSGGQFATRIINELRGQFINML